MTRTTILVVAVAGLAGLAIGFLGFASPTMLGTPTGPQLKKVQRPVVHGYIPPPPESPRTEFALGADDVSNDRETPAVAVDAKGRVLLAWAIQKGENTRTIQLARSSDGGKTFDGPTPLRDVPIYKFTSQGKGKAMAFSTHVLPRLVAVGDEMYLAWVEAINGGPEVVEFLARSSDGGRTFGEPTRVHGKEASRPGFTTLSAAPDGTLLAAWLDGRAKKGQQPYFTTKPAASEGFEADRLVFAGSESKGICPCCDLATLRLPDGSDLVAFRNSDGGHRDVWVARAAKGSEFAPPTPLSPDRWTFDGCPHDGPSLTLDGDQVYAAWMSAHSGKNQVYAAKASAGDLAFRPLPLGHETGRTQGHPKLAQAGPGKVYAVWDESLDAAPAASSTPTAKGGHEGHQHGAARTGSGRAIMFAEGSNSFNSAWPVAPREGSFQLNPAIAINKEGMVLVAWNELDSSGKRVVLVLLDPAKGR